MRSKSTMSGKAHLLVAALQATAFVVAIWLPLLDMWIGLDGSPRISEKRELLEWPKSWDIGDLDELPEELEAYYSDHFGFRNALIWLNGRLRRLTGANPLDTRVVIGKSDWLYLNSGELMDDRRAVLLYSEDALEQRARTLVRRQRQLSEMGIRYLYVVAPDKHSIYPEFLPDRVRQANGFDRTQQLIEYLRDNTDLELVDLRRDLLAAKPERQLYNSNDTHWNEYGAYIAYRSVQQRVAEWYPAATPFPLDDFEVSFERRSGDLAAMLGLQDTMISEHILVQRRRPSRSVRTNHGLAEMAGEVRAERAPFAYESEEPSLPRAVMFRDSFAIALTPLLSEHYQRISYYWMGFDLETVRHEMPQIVIEERVGREAAFVPDVAGVGTSIPPG